MRSAFFWAAGEAYLIFYRWRLFTVFLRVFFDWHCTMHDVVISDIMKRHHMHFPIQFFTIFPRENVFATKVALLIKAGCFDQTRRQEIQLNCLMQFLKTLWRDTRHLPAGNLDKKLEVDKKWLLSSSQWSAEGGGGGIWGKLVRRQVQSKPTQSMYIATSYQNQGAGAPSIAEKNTIEVHRYTWSVQQRLKVMVKDAKGWSERESTVASQLHKLLKNRDRW